MCYLFQSTCRLISHWNGWSFCVYMGTFYLVKISRNFSSAVNGKRLLVHPTGKFSEKVEILKRLVPYGGPQLSRQNQKPCGKNNASRQNQKPHGKMKIPHGKTKYFTAKTNSQTAKANTHSKTKAILPLLWSIWFCCEVFGFAVRYFVFTARFLVLPWRLWATVWYQLSMKSPSSRAILNRTKDFLRT